MTEKITQSEITSFYFQHYALTVMRYFSLPPHPPPLRLSVLSAFLNLCEFAKVTPNQYFCKRREYVFGFSIKSYADFLLIKKRIKKLSIKLINLNVRCSS